MTDSQKARAWDALKVAASTTMDSAFFNARLRRDCLSFLGLMAEVEARVLKADSPPIKTGAKP